MGRNIFNILFVALMLLVHLTNGLYIKTKIGKPQLSENVKDKWSIFQQKLGLTNRKVEILKSQKDQKATINLLNRFMKENPEYITVNENNKETKEEDTFLNIYHTLLQQFKASTKTLKTSLHFELADNSKSRKNLKRSPRKIAVKMVTDMPAEQIDDLLAVFNRQHGIDATPHTTNDDLGDTVYKDDDYDDLARPFMLPTSDDTDYLYENLYEDEEDSTAPNGSLHTRNSQFGSFQDLILQVKSNQWQQDMEESKLRTNNNNHFV